MKLPALINDLALAIYSEARKMVGVETLKMTASRRTDSDSRYIRINQNCGNACLIRISSHYATDDDFDLNLVVKNQKEQSRALRSAYRYLTDLYGPEIQAA